MNKIVIHNTKLQVGALYFTKRKKNVFINCYNLLCFSLSQIFDTHSLFLPLHVWIADLSQGYEGLLNRLRVCPTKNIVWSTSFVVCS